MASTSRPLSGKFAGFVERDHAARDAQFTPFAATFDAHSEHPRPR